MMAQRVTDLEKLAIRRDRGYLVRLLLMLALGVCASIFVMKWLTGSRTVGCLTDSFLGQEPAAKPAGAPVPSP